MRIIFKALILIFFNFSFSMAQDLPPDQESDQEEKEVSKSGNWITNGNIVSQISLSELRENHRIYILNSPNQQIVEELLKKRIEAGDTNIPPPISKLSPQLQKAIREIIHSDDFSLKDILDMSIIDETSKDNAKKELLKVKLQSLLSGSDFIQESSDTQTSSEISWEYLVDIAPPSSVIIQNIDISQSMKIEKYDVEENIVELSGRIVIQMGPNTLSANRVIINLDTRYLSAEGNLIFENETTILKGDKAIFNILENIGSIQGPWGLINDIYVQGEVANLNSLEHYSIIHGIGSFDAKTPIFLVEATSIEYYGDKKIAAFNAQIKIHNHPILYSPFFIQDPWGTKFDTRYGFTQREGIFIQAMSTFFLPYINNLSLQLNYYQKLGFHFQLENEQKTSIQNYSIKLGLASFYDGFYRGSTYNIYSGEELKTKTYFRGKLDYEHTFNLTSEKLRSNNINTTINYKIYKTGKTEDGESFFKNNDPHFTSDFEKRTPSFLSPDLLLKNEPYSQSIYTPSASDKDDYSITIAQSIPQSLFQIKHDFNYDIQEKDEINQQYIRSKYYQYLKEIIAPDISFSHSGVIDPKRSFTEDSYENKKESFDDIFLKPRKIFAEINYNIKTSYNHTMNFNLNKSRESEDFHYSHNKYTLDFSLSRVFKLEKNIYNQFIKFMNIDYKITLGNKYQHYWGGEFTEDLNLDESNKKSTFDDIYFKNELSIYLPSKNFYDSLEDVIGYLPIIPLASLNIGYNLTGREELEEEDRINENYKYFKDMHLHELSLKPKIEQSIYGIFYIPYLDLTHSFSMSYLQSFLPKINDDESKENYRYIPLSNKNQIFLKEWIYDYNVSLFYEPINLGYKVINFSYTYKHEVFNTGENLLHNKGLYQQFDFYINYRDTNRSKFFILDLISIKTSYKYYFQEKDYSRDTIDFIFSFKFTLSKYVQFEFGILSQNSRAYLYNQKKSDFSGEPKINFFNDILSSFLFVGSSHAERVLNQRQSNFKIKNIFTSIQHDMRTWFLKFTYSTEPQLISEDSSLSGFYLTHSFYIEIGMKPKFFVSDYINDLLKPLETSSIPSELDFIRDQTTN